MFDQDAITGMAVGVTVGAAVIAAVVLVLGLLCGLLALVFNNLELVGFVNHTAAVGML